MSRKCLLLSVALLATRVVSESIVITAPITDVTVAEGDDYAIQVAGNRWDMSNLRDIPLETGFNPPFVTNGIWTGISDGPNAAVIPLLRGYSWADFEEHLPMTPSSYTNYFSWYNNGMPYGTLYPVDAGKYTTLSFRSALDHDKRSRIVIYWTKNFRYSAYEQGNLFLFNDGDKSKTNYLHYPGGFRIYDVDLTAQDFFRERVQPDVTTMFDEPYTEGTWDGDICGFLMHFSHPLDAGTKHEIDWIRLYDPKTSPRVTIQWETENIPVSDNDYTVQLFVDTKNSGYEGDLFMTGIVNDGSYEFYTAALPPGIYYVYLEVVYRDLNSFNLVARSGYSAPITISPAPSFEFAAPSFTSGVDYATSELGQPWDMSSPGVVSSYDYISNLRFEDGLLKGTADPPAPGMTESDAQIWMNTKSGGNVVPIDTSKYRYLNVRMIVNDHVKDRIGHGWVARFIWAYSYFSVDGTVSKDIPLNEGWGDYYVDLWDTNLVESRGNLDGMSQRGWTAIPQLSQIRWDPVEVPEATDFAIDYIKLCAVNTAENDSYTIRWNAQSHGGGDMVIELFHGRYDANENYQEAENSFAVLTNSPGPGSYEWNTAGLRPGEYHIRASVSDGTSSFSHLSRVPVVVGSSGCVMNDYNGDGSSDFAVFCQNTGAWFVLGSDQTTQIAWNLGWGWPGAWPVPGDYNGDGKSDFAVFDQNTGAWFVLGANQSTHIAWGVEFGWPGAWPVSGDYNGDGKSDFAVFCQLTGNWYVLSADQETVLAWGVEFGWPGAWPVSGDYNGDGKNDFAVFCQNTGNWYVLDSNQTDVLVWGMEFGWPGAWPVPGDYNGDGKSDFAVFCQHTGAWFVLDANQTDVLAWGLGWGWPGALPVGAKTP